MMRTPASDVSASWAPLQGRPSGLILGIGPDVGTRIGGWVTLTMCRRGELIVPGTWKYESRLD